jgi:hypothetical protein
LTDTASYTGTSDARPGSNFPKLDSAQNWNERYQKARMARMNFERKWYTNLAFVSGKQYIQWNYESAPLATGRMVEPVNPNNRVRLVINKTRRILRKELAKINKEAVRGYVIPNNTDDNSQAAARAADNLADYLTDELKMQFVFKQADWWMLICGTSFIKGYYDPSLQMGYGKMQVMNPMTGQPVSQMVPLMGAPFIETVSPFHILVPNLDEPDLQKQDWVMHVSMKSPEWVKQRFKQEVDGVSVSTNTLESRLMAIQGMTNDAERQKAVEIREIWVRPGKSENYPNGCVITCTQDKILEHIDQYPYQHGKFPFIKRSYIENSIFYAATLVEDLMPLQVEYNRTRSQIVEDKNRMGRPQLAIERGSMDPKKLRGTAGDVIEYAPGSRAPQPIEISGLPNYIIDHVNRISSEMAELASQESTDKNAIPSGVTAATAIAYIYEDQDALVQDTIRDKEIGWEAILQMLLSYVGQFWDGQRAVTVAGKNNSFETYLFSQSDLSGQTNWRSIIGSATPQSYAAKQAQIMELMKMGAISVADGLEYMDMGDTSRLYEEQQLDKREAQKENIRIGNGVWASVEQWQEHLIHIHEHDNVRKREEYESWDDKSKQMIAYHTVTHMERFLSEVGFQAPIGPGGMPDQNFVMMQQQQAQQNAQAAQMGQIPPINPSYEAALRTQIARLTLPPTGPPPPGGAPTTPPPPAPPA